MSILHTLKQFTGAAVLAAVSLTAAQFSAAPKASAAVFVSVGIAPPAIPVYEQPLCPGDGYIWTPGYWAWNGEGYKWVDGAWVAAPYVGALWTPGYWGFVNGGYFWHAGYWGRTVGYYGGINYGFGYFGAGFYGGRWNGGHFFYNTAYNRVNVNNIHNVYVNRVSGFDGRPGGAAFTNRPSLVAGNHGSTVQNANFGNHNGFSGTQSFNNNTARGFAGNSQQPNYRGNRQNYATPSNNPGAAQHANSYARPSASALTARPSGGGGFHGGSQHGGHH